MNFFVLIYLCNCIDYEYLCMKRGLSLSRIFSLSLSARSARNGMWEKSARSKNQFNVGELGCGWIKNNSIIDCVQCTANRRRKIENIVIIIIVSNGVPVNQHRERKKKQIHRQMNIAWCECKNATQMGLKFELQIWKGDQNLWMCLVFTMQIDYVTENLSIELMNRKTNWKNMEKKETMSSVWNTTNTNNVNPHLLLTDFDKCDFIWVVCWY